MLRQVLAIAAMEARRECGADPRRTGIILATAFGPHATVFRFVNEMLDFGDAKTSPTVFSQSVHAAAASMIATAAGLHGPVLSLADLAMPFEEALTLAECWLASERCDSGEVDVCPSCNGLWRDAGELGTVVESRGSFFHSCLRILRGRGPGSVHLASKQAAGRQN